MRTSALLLCLVALSVSPAAILGAQDAPVLRGTLRDSLGLPMPRVEVSHRQVRTLTDSAGNFRLQPVPTGRITVRFVRDGSLIGEVEANVTSDTMPSVVVDSSNVPMRDVIVELVTTLAESRTDSLGRFSFRDLPARRHLLRVRRVGYSPTFAAVDLTDNTSKRARIVLRQYAGQNLGLVVVRAVRPMGRMRGFQQRAERRSGWGRILTEKDIAARNPMQATDVFQTIAGLRVNQDRFGRGVLTGRGGCLMAVFINGFPAPQLRGAGIDDMVNVLDLAGVEVYNSQAGVPMELTNGPPNMCGTVGIWTK